MMQASRTPFLLLALAGTLLAGACAPDRPWLMEQSTLTPHPIALVESRHIVKKPLASLSDADITAAARDYARNGAGPIYLVVAHNDLAKSNLSDRTAKIAATLEQQGVAHDDIIASTIPLDTPEAVALIAFDTLEAQAPVGCKDMPGLKTLPGEASDFDYTLGCGVKGMMAKQIANPKDLNGVAGLGGSNDGERAANIASELRTGKTREFLPSYVVSALAGSGS